MHDFHVRPAVRDDTSGIAALGGVMGYEVAPEDVTARLRSLPTEAAVYVANDDTGAVVGFDCGLLQVRSGVERAAAHGFYEHAGYRRLKQQQVFTKTL